MPRFSKNFGAIADRTYKIVHYLCKTAELKKGGGDNMDMSFGISSNVLVAGETGTGKTYFLKALIKEITQKRDSEATI